MALISIDDLQPEMILAKDATYHNGRVLLSAGTSLTGKHINIFKTWGLVEVDIEGITKEEVEASKDEQLDPVLLQNAEKELLPIFQHANLNHPVLNEIFRTRVRQRASRKEDKAS